MPEAALRSAGYIRVEDLAGAYEIEQMTGVSRNVICQWSRRHAPGWPEPAAHLAQGAVYDLAAVRKSDRVQWKRER